MIQLAKALWIGNSTDEGHADLDADGIVNVLNVAQDMQCTRGWMDGIEYAQVGLIDGPGNLPAMYHAAVLALAGLCEKGTTLVVCHSGGRALAVALMYLNLTAPRGWDNWLGILCERIEDGLPAMHQAHKDAFDKLNWKVLSACIDLY